MALDLTSLSRSSFDIYRSLATSRHSVSHGELDETLRGVTLLDCVVYFTTARLDECVYTQSCAV